jgi:hypothetical protein
MRDDYEPFDMGGRTEYDGEDIALTKDEFGRASIVPRSLLKLPPDVRAEMARVQRIASKISELQEELGQVVAEMREEGVSWAAIGWCVGTTGDAARKRWVD